MHKTIFTLVLGMGYLLSGCSLLQYYSGKSLMEIEQIENPMLWREISKIEVSLWPLERKVSQMEKTVNEMEKNANVIGTLRDELATTKLSSIQAHKNIETLQAEIQQLKSELISKEQPAAESKPEIKNTKETTPTAVKSPKSGTDILSTILTDIRYSKISDTHDKVLIYVNAMNDPKLQTLRGENPRLVWDFFNARPLGKDLYEIGANGNFIKRIRVRAYKDPPQKVRVVFDMMPNKKYSVERKFSETEKMYSFDIKANGYNP